ncbi:MAG: hypothetical protein K6357_00990 [Elusimicrobiota bacterium]
MRKFFILFISTLFVTSCISSKKTSIVSRSEILETEKKNKKPYKQLLVQWKNYSYADFHKVNNLEKEAESIRMVEVDEEIYKKFKKQALKIFKENGLYDEINGTGTIKILLITYGRWNYSELFSTFLVDTGYVLILPSSINVAYRMIVKSEQDGIEYKLEKKSSVKTTFHFLLFPLYPFASFSGAEKSVLKNMLYETIIDLVKMQENQILEKNNNKTTP